MEEAARITRLACIDRIVWLRERTDLGIGFTLGYALFGGIFLCYLLVLFGPVIFQIYFGVLLCVFFCVYLLRKVHAAAWVLTFCEQFL